MRPEWRQAIATQYLWSDYGDVRWRSSAALEQYLLEAVGQDSLRRGYEQWGPGAPYDDANWMRDGYPEWYLGFYAPIYIASLQRVLLSLSPVRGGQPLRVLDVGVGSGTTALALADLLNTAHVLGLGPGLELELTCLEIDEGKVPRARSNVVAFAAQVDDGIAETVVSLADEGDWLVGDVGCFEEHLPREASYDLIILGNVVRELERNGERTGDRRSVEAVARLLASTMLAPGGTAVVLEPGYETGVEFVRVVCRFWQYGREAGLVVLEPDGHECGCDDMVVDGCSCVQSFRLEWPRGYGEWIGALAEPRRVRSIWSAVGRPDDSGALMLPGLLRAINAVDVGHHGLRCPVCEGALRLCERRDGYSDFLGCRSTCGDVGSVTEVDGSVRVPRALDHVTRRNKRTLVDRLVAHEAEAVRLEAEKARLRVELEKDAAAERFEFKVDEVYRNSVFEFRVVRVEGERLWAIRLDTGAEVKLARKIAARNLVS